MSQSIRSVEAELVSRRGPTIWGYSVHDLHDMYWAEVPVQVVRPGDECLPDGEQGLFLLLGPRELVLLDDIAGFAQRMAVSRKAQVTRVTLSPDQGCAASAEGHWYREVVEHDDEGRFLGFRREYAAGGSEQTLLLTSRRWIAELWRDAEGDQEFEQRLGQLVADQHWTTLRVAGSRYQAERECEQSRWLQGLVGRWQPDAIEGAAAVPQREEAVWTSRDARVPQGSRIVGPAWVGEGWDLSDEDLIVGPTVLWDRPSATSGKSGTVYPSLWRTSPMQPDQPQPVLPWGKRVFDVLAATFGLVCTLPFYPLVLLLIWLDDGRPFFFAHTRETLGGKAFPCFKFRTMRRDAEQLKQHLMAQNHADGPQFFIENDPRLTRVGKWFRRLHIDEWPQLFNVLLGHMSLVGPRPSPYKENQLCPEWREARLSVRPGISGLWQVRRTRQPGLDFQEWIRYDLEYVQRVSLWQDAKIVIVTVMHVIGGGFSEVLRARRVRRWVRVAGRLPRRLFAGLAPDSSQGDLPRSPANPLASDQNA